MNEDIIWYEKQKERDAKYVFVIYECLYIIILSMFCLMLEN